MSYEMTTKNQIPFSELINTEQARRQIGNVLQDPDRAMRFTASLTSAVATNPALRECSPTSILSAALLGESLELSPSPQLGQYFMVPFKDKKANEKKAQFILGYKGYLQLAIRSGQYRYINVVEIKEGELKTYDPLHDRIECMAISDPVKRKHAKTIGYYGFFELLNGFFKAVYVPVEEMEIYADTYSPAFSLAEYRKIKSGKVSPDDMWKYSSFWYKSFDVMAKKTIVRTLMNSGYAPLSIQMQRAIDADESVPTIGDAGQMDDAFENDAETQKAPPERKRRAAKKDAAEQPDEYRSELPFSLDEEELPRDQEDMFDIENA